MTTPPISTPAQAAEFLRPFKPTLSGAIRGAFEDYAKLLTNSPKETAGLSAQHHRRYIHDRTVFHLNRAELEAAVAGLRLEKVRGGLYVVILRDQMVLKLKKLDVTLRSKNIQTGQTKAFNVQESLLSPDVGRVTNATSGYVPDVLAGGIGRLLVVCWDGGNRLWNIALDDAEEESGGPVVTLPAEPTTPAAGGARPRTKIVKPDVAKPESE